MRSRAFSNKKEWYEKKFLKELEAKIAMVQHLFVLAGIT